MNNINTVLIILLLFISCTRNISEKELKYMPYESGQYLIFENQSNREIDTVLISNIKKFIPDGLQVYSNETVNANNKSEDFIVSLTSAYGKHTEPYIRISGLSGKHFLEDLEKKPELNFKTRTLSFKDVIIIEKKGNVGKIDTVYWSKSTGIVKYITKNNSIWSLVKIDNLN